MHNRASVDFKAVYALLCACSGWVTAARLCERLECLRVHASWTLCDDAELHVVLDKILNGS